MKIGFIGLGNMGAPMAANLVAAGHDVTGFDLTAPAPQGVRMAASAAGAATGAEVVITMLPNGAILRAGRRRGDPGHGPRRGAAGLFHRRCGQRAAVAARQMAAAGGSALWMRRCRAASAGRRRAR